MQTHYDQDRDDVEGQGDDVDDVEPADEGPRVGDVVSVTHLDTSTQTDVVRYGQVVEVVDLAPSDQGIGGGPAVRVGWFSTTSDPIPLDHECHGRIDAPRVTVVDTAS